MKLLTALTPLLVWALFVFLSLNAEAQTSVYETILAEKNIGIDPPSLAKYLRGLQVTPQQQEQVKLLIQQLGDSSFAVREEATKQLLVMPKLSTEELRAAMAGSDPEIRWRAQQLLDVGNPEAVRVMHAAFQVIAAKQMPEVTAELLAAIPLCDQLYLQSAARRAIEMAARPQDAVILREALRDKNADVRVAAAAALGKTLGLEARRELQPLLKDGADQVKLAAAQALADLGDRECLSTLVAMLESDELPVFAAAADTLQQLSGKQLGFVSYGTAEERAKIVTQWKAWVSGEGKTAKLNLPLKRFETGGSNLRGNTLLAFGNIDKVAEYDPAGKEIWTYQARNPWSAEKMTNGNVLIAELAGNRVVQVSPQGKVVWQFEVANPLDAKPLENGNVLIAQHSDPSQVIEVNLEGKVVWKYAVKGSCSEVYRLENGNTLIASCGVSIFEVTREGKVIWEYAAPDARGCQPLPGGNVLITSFASGQVIEVTRENKIVWECQLDHATDVFRLPNGNTLITGSHQFAEVTPDKKIVWSKEGCQHGSARR